jgi:hypothetical protein
MMVLGGKWLDGLWFETWRRLYRQGVVDYCISVVWQFGSFGRLEESLDLSSMLCGIFTTLWMNFQ